MKFLEFVGLWIRNKLLNMHQGIFSLLFNIVKYVFLLISQSHFLGE